MSWDVQEAEQMIDLFLQAIPAATPGAPILQNAIPGKVFELWVLCDLLSEMHHQNGYDIHLHNADGITLKTSPGPINLGYAHFRLDCGNGQAITVWTDVEFWTLSHHMTTAQGPWPLGDRSDKHELDIVVVDEGVVGYPSHADVRLGVECKSGNFSKSDLRAILGVRRELSLLRPSQPTVFSKWPAPAVRASPASCLMLRARDPAWLNYREAGRLFSIDIDCLAVP